MLSPRRSVALLVALALLTTGTALGVLQYRTANGYATTIGTVDTAKIDTYTEIGKPTLGGNQYYQPNVTYTSRVDGQVYTGTDIAFGSDVDTNQRDRAARILSHYDDGSSVSVYYNPKSPDDAYLVQRFDFFPAGVLVTFGLLLLGDALTPRTRWLRLVLSRIPLNQNERHPFSQSDTDTEVPEDPTRVLDETEPADDDSDREAPASGRLAVALWSLCGLAALGTVAVYLAVSRPPHDLTAYAVALVTVLGAGRFAYRRTLE